ncbi:MAG: hypothetical protein DRQ52_10785, partial [Gammaproteobacteria bacterium]
QHSQVIAADDFGEPLRQIDVDIDLSQRLTEIVRRDYLAVLDEVAAFVLRVESKQSNVIPEIPKGLD